MVPRMVEHDYVLGTHDAEIERLALQHRVWRERMLDAWRRAGFRAGQVLVDVGCGPGYAAIDLAEITGPRGHVVAVDRSQRFLDVLEAARSARGVEYLASFACDLDVAPLPVSSADGAWCRWVLSFVARPEALLVRIRDALVPGGRLVLHEYFDYGTWRMAPREPELEVFVERVMESWRERGGEPDIALAVPAWLERMGFEVLELQTLIDVVRPRDPAWRWLCMFVDVGLERLVELGQLTPERAGSIRAAIAGRNAGSHEFMVTPGVLEIIAERA